MYHNYSYCFAATTVVALKSMLLLVLWSSVCLHIDGFFLGRSPFIKCIFNSVSVNVYHWKCVYDQLYKNTIQWNELREIERSSAQ